MKKLIYTDRAPRAFGPYSQGVLSGNTLFLSGQVGIDPKTGKIVSGGIEAQTHRAIQNLTAVLEAAGMGLKDVVKTTIYLASMEDFQKVNEIYGEYFSENPPTRAALEVAQLPIGAHIEIEAIAQK